MEVYRGREGKVARLLDVSTLQRPQKVVRGENDSFASRKGM